MQNMINRLVRPGLLAVTGRWGRWRDSCTKAGRRFHKRRFVWLLAGLPALLISGCATRTVAEPRACPALATEIATARNTLIAGPWFDHGVNPAGGFYQSMDVNWRVTDPANNFVVFQARQTWAAARLAETLRPEASRYRSIALHGLKHLQTNMWDHAHGGFWWRAPNDPGHVHHKAGWKMLYGQAFGIYAAAAVYRSTGDRRALELAEAGFEWVERHMADVQATGYIEVVQRDGRSIPPGPPELNDLLGVPIGCKSLNAHLHLMEAYTELYRAAPRSDLAQKLEALLMTVRDHMCRAPGSAGGLFDRRFNPLDQRASYGHDLETGFLMVDTARALGLTGPALERTWYVAEMLINHAMQNGLDAGRGAWFDSGPIGAPADQFHSTFWAQAEAMNAMLMMHRRLGSQDRPYWPMFVETWRFYRDRLLDRQRGGSFEVVRRDGTVPHDKTDKATPWKAAYHELRALNHAVRWLSETE